MAPASVQKILYTIDDIYALPDGSRAELIDGQIYYMALPSRTHQDIVGELFGTIREYTNSNNGLCRPYIAPFAVFLNEDDKNYVEPDISVICKPDKLTDKGCFGAPDWIVDPEKNRVLVYDFESENTGDYTFSDSVKAGIYEDFSIDFAAISSLLNI